MVSLLFLIDNFLQWQIMQQRSANENCKVEIKVEYSLNFNS